MDLCIAGTLMMTIDEVDPPEPCMFVSHACGQTTIDEVIPRRTSCQAREVFDASREENIVEEKLHEKKTH